jgi:2-polyprenyl-3-methyl-5-hydroxy-6-metoxy-1,4-benzoquinol methylase
MSIATSSLVDTALAQTFMGRVLSDTSACMVTAMAALGDRLGLFKSLATNGPCTADEVAAHTRTQPRYAREWLGGMAAAGYITYEPATKRFSLPAAHAAVLAEEGGPFFVGGAFQLSMPKLQQFERVAEVFTNGGGVMEAAYGEDLWQGQARFSAGWVEHLLTQAWVPSVDGLERTLRQGAAIADVGCGRGLALIKLAQAYPESYFVGYDAFEPEIQHATENERAAGVADRVRFQYLDASRGLPSQYDVITTFDVVHDAVDPPGLLRSIRQALKPNSVYMCLEISCADRLEDNVGPLGALFHALSVFYCMTTSLAHGGAGLGTLGLPESRLRELSLNAGFSGVRRVPMDNPFNALYEMRP